MRITRLDKFRKKRRNGVKRLFLFVLVIPTFTLAAGYFISSLIIIPAINK